MLLIEIPTCEFLSMSAFPADYREKRVLDVAADWWRRRCAGNVIPEAELFERYPELPELAVRGALLRRLAMEASFSAGTDPTSSATQQPLFSFEPRWEGRVIPAYFASPSARPNPNRCYWLATRG